MSISQASKECPKQRQIQPRIINKSTKWIGMQDQLSQPITFHFSCLATQQMHAQHYSVICEKYFRHVMSTAASFPFISAAFLHGGQAALISPWHWTCSLSPHLGSTLTDSAKRLSTNSHASTLILQIYYIKYQRVALAFVEVDINAFFWGRQPEEIGLWVTIVKRNKCKQVRKAVICARYSIKEQVSKEEAMQNGEQSRLAQVKGQLRDKGKGSVVSRQACSHAIIFIIITAIMFKQGWGSPRSKAAEAQEESSILSPRNFIKLITSGIGELKNNLSTPSQANYQQFVATFAPYLQSFRQEIQKYNKARSRQHSTNSKHQQLQLELRINKIPAEYFEEPQRFRLELFRRSEGGKRQEELSEFLDEIELILFTRAGKYPEKSSIILQNMVMLEGETERSLQKVVQFRRQVKERLTVHSQRQLKVKRIQQKMQRMKRVLGYIQMIKKMKDLKDISCAAQKEGGNEQVLLRIRKNEIEQCASFTSLAPILTNLERYRQSVKQRLYKEFLKHIEAAINHLLLYNKEDWKTINVPSAIFVGQTAQNDLSHNNITVLDQSYFAFESNNANIVHKKKLADTEAIEQQNEQQGAQTIETQKMVRSWALIQQFDLYDEVEVNEQFVKLLMKHNIRFNQDMQEYISYLYESQVQERKVGCILKGPQTYASLRNKQKEEAKHQSLQNNQDNIQLSSEKISFMDMRLFLKITRFYFGLLKKVLSFINAPTQMKFLTNLRHKFAEFLQGNITYFTSLKKITHDLSVDDFLNYLQIINYWENEELDEITEFCQNLKAAKIEEYLTNVQKNLLIKQLKQAIEQSTYLPTPVSSDNYMTFHAVLSPKSQPQFDNEQINMSMTLQLAENRLQADRVEGGEQPKEEVILRLITNYVVYRGKAYKICDSFLELAKSIEKYVSIKEALPETAQNVEQKICEIIGFYAWYNQKQIGNTKKAIRTLSNHCTFYSTLLLLKCVLHSLSITSKKLEKTKIQLNECQNQLHKSITMTPFLQIQQKISQLYESKISTRVQAPTGQSVKILEILKTSIDCLLEFFPIQYEQKIHESFIYRFMQNTVKIIYKNYFGYLVNMEKRGIAEVKWFLPKIKEILRITTINTAALVNRKGELLCKHGTLTFFLFNQEIQEMERILSQKAALKH